MPYVKFWERILKNIVPITMMMMAMRIQHKYVNLEYDFSSYIEEEIYQGPIKVREHGGIVVFKYYSLLCHLIMYQHKYEWDDKIKLKFFDNEGKKFPI